MTGRILIVEDDSAMACVLKDNLEFEGFEAAWAQDAERALPAYEEFRPGLVLLDLMLPRRDGFAVCADLANRPDPPAIIVLSALNQTDEKVRALHLGADDYVTKPFVLKELLARIHRRLCGRKSDQVRLGDVVVDFRKREAWARDVQLDLTEREFQILRYLAERAGRVVSRDELLRDVWGYIDPAPTRGVDQAIARLRRKVDPERRYIRTAHGDGYCLILKS